MPVPFVNLIKNISLCQPHWGLLFHKKSWGWGIWKRWIWLTAHMFGKHPPWSMMCNQKVPLAGNKSMIYQSCIPMAENNPYTRWAPACRLYSHAHRSSVRTQSFLGSSKAFDRDKRWVESLRAGPHKSSLYQYSGFLFLHVPLQADLELKSIPLKDSIY